MGTGIKNGKEQRLRGGLGTAELAEAEERKKETARNPQGLGRGIRVPHLGFSPAALGLGPAWGLTASAIDPAMAQSPLVFVKTLRVPQPADFRPSTVT